MSGFAQPHQRNFLKKVSLESSKTFMLLEIVIFVLIKLWFYGIKSEFCPGAAGLFEKSFFGIFKNLYSFEVIAFISYLSFFYFKTPLILFLLCDKI